jgi:2'-5' RNA ligase
MHRLFAALPVPDDIAERLLPLKADLFGARWRRRDHYHITLQFYGKVHEEVANEIADALARLQAPQMTLELSGVGWFGSKQPRALYARIRPDDALSELARECRKIARRLGVKLSQDPFLPHITLAYCNETPLEEAMQWSEDFQLLRGEPFMVDSFHLYESFTGHRKQSQYVPQADYPLGF